MSDDTKPKYGVSEDLGIRDGSYDGGPSENPYAMEMTAFSEHYSRKDRKSGLWYPDRDADVFFKSIGRPPTGRDLYGLDEGKLPLLQQDTPELTALAHSMRKRAEMRAAAVAAVEAKLPRFVRRAVLRVKQAFSLDVN